MKADTPKDDLRIISLEAENFKRLSAITIRPDGSLIVISGRNGQGKTSALDAIAAAIGGKKAAPKEPIKQGHARAEINLDLGRFKLKRTFTRHDNGEIGSTLVLEQANGARPKTPQALLDDLMGELAFDPLDFLRKAPKDRFDTLKLLVPEVDFDGIAAQRKSAFDRRTDVNRDAKRERAAGQTITVPPDTPAVAPDITDLVAKMRQAGVLNAELETRRARRKQAADDIDDKLARAERLHAEATSLEAQAAELQTKLDAAPALPAAIDTAVMQDEIANAGVIADAVAKRTQRKRHIDQATELEDVSATLTAKIEQLDTEKLDAIAKAKMPAGLSFGADDDVQLGGVPFEQASAAEQLRASTAIAMALNPKLRVILIRDGSLLDADSMKLLAQLAADNEYQVFIERVAGDKPAGIVIEDGRVA